MDLWVNVCALGAVAAAASTPPLGAAAEFKAEAYNSSEMLDNLRRQLMKDNYDYIEEASPTRPYRYHAESDDGQLSTESYRVIAESTLETPVDFYTKVTSGDITWTTVDLRDLRRNPMFDQRSKYVVPVERRKLATAGADKVLYGEGDGDNSRRQHYIYTTTDAAAEPSEPREHRRHATAASTTVKYSLLKVGARRGGRRAHLVKAEKPGEVSIVNLGAGAVPQFRLPRPRAQYMRDSEPESARASRKPLPAVDLD